MTQTVRNLSALFIVAAFSTSISQVAFAQYSRNRGSSSGSGYTGTTESYGTPASTTMESSSGEASGGHAISGAFGIYAPGQNILAGKSAGVKAQSSLQTLSGLFGIGGDYEYLYKKELTFGALFRYYSTSDTIVTTEVKNSLLSVAAFTRGYLRTSMWSFYGSVGAGILAPSLSVGGTELSVDTGFGFLLSVGLLYKLTPSVSIGVENMKLYGLGSKINGIVADDLMFKARFIIGG